MSSPPLTRRQLATRGVAAFTGACLTATLSPAHAQPQLSPIPDILCKSIHADGIDIFYREAGRPDAPVLLLLHGFPNSSIMFQQLMPRLAHRYRLIAPDIPSFGFTAVPSARNYPYTFAAFAQTLTAFTDALALKHYGLYVFDFGAPIGFRHALAHPERIAFLVSQNGNAYEEGLGEAFWKPVRAAWQDPTPERLAAIRSRVTFTGIRDFYLLGVPHPEAIPPETYWLDSALIERPGIADIQVNLKLDYATNLQLYPHFQEFFRATQLPTLAIWGRNDPAFIPPGAEAFRRDLPRATVRLLDTGHFALVTHVDEIAAAILKM